MMFVARMSEAKSGICLPAFRFAPYGLLFRGTMKKTAFSAGPITDFRNVARIDPFVGQPPKGREFILLLCGEPPRPTARRFGRRRMHAIGRRVGAAPREGQSLPSALEDARPGLFVLPGHHPSSYRQSLAISMAP